MPVRVGTGFFSVRIGRNSGCLIDFFEIRVRLLRLRTLLSIDETVKKFHWKWKQFNCNWRKIHTIYSILFPNQNKIEKNNSLCEWKRKPCWNGVINNVFVVFVSVSVHYSSIESLYVFGVKCTSVSGVYINIYLSYFFKCIHSIHP